jgi:hypothetical protein
LVPCAKDPLGVAGHGGRLELKLHGPPWSRVQRILLRSQGMAVVSSSSSMGSTSPTATAMGDLRGSAFRRPADQGSGSPSSRCRFPPLARSSSSHPLLFLLWRSRGNNNKHSQISLLTVATAGGRSGRGRGDGTGRRDRPRGCGGGAGLRAILVSSSDGGKKQRYVGTSTARLLKLLWYVEIRINWNCN